METYIDWNCSLLELDPKERIETIKELSTRCGVFDFCFMNEYNASHEAISVFLLRKHRNETRLRDELKALKGIRIKSLSYATLSPDLSEVPDLESLLYPSTNGYLPLALPLQEYADWVDTELNHLLYRRSMKLWFTSCELLPIFYPSDFCERLYRIKDAIYQFSYKSLADEHTCKVIRSLHNSGKTVLLGNAARSLMQAYQFDFDDYKKSAAKIISPADFQRILHSNRTLWQG